MLVSVPDMQASVLHGETLVASRVWLVSITACGLVVLQPRAVAQDASALARIEETRAGGQEACATGRKFRLAFSHSISESAIVKAVA